MSAPTPPGGSGSGPVGPRGPEGRRDLPPLNERIRDRELRLIDEEGAQLGIMPTREALGIARERGLDLFVVQPDAAPPVAKIMDYGRYKYDLEKRAREAKKKQHIVDVKEIKMRYKIEDHDYQVKLRNAIKFLGEGDKIKVLLQLRGREVQHAQIALKLMYKFFDELEGIGIYDREPKLEGKSIIMILSPNPQNRPQNPPKDGGSKENAKDGSHKEGSPKEASAAKEAAPKEAPPAKEAAVKETSPSEPASTEPVGG